MKNTWLLYSLIALVCTSCAVTGEADSVYMANFTKYVEGHTWLLQRIQTSEGEKAFPAERHYTLRFVSDIVTCLMDTTSCEGSYWIRPDGALRIQSWQCSAGTRDPFDHEFISALSSIQVAEYAGGMLRLHYGTGKTMEFIREDSAQ